VARIGNQRKGTGHHTEYELTGYETKIERDAPGKRAMPGPRSVRVVVAVIVVSMIVVSVMRGVTRMVVR
jgi:hypothetical protein